MPNEKTIKLKYIGKDEVHLVRGNGPFDIITKGDVREFPESQAQGFLRNKAVEYKKGKKVEIPKWEVVKEKKEGKE
ncbi:hypothetical protein AMJ74_04995 [candidate division WOR_3 bacterium SM1_77]|uniref:Uncharacterized protein n=1 Tax=candidate division WOR_3 bacterium SM1_77 TaxID=1703778 RepID=A0A0S8JY43_UNCW3|nr:MAG: hypothetical protein AMJ74_04995 [candidate division WOR_3 bacterium SM1_77]